MKRMFHYKPGGGKPELKLADPDPALSPDEVRAHFAMTMNACATLISATVEPPQVVDDVLIYHFRNNLGTKG